MKHIITGPGRHQIHTESTQVVHVNPHEIGITGMDGVTYWVPLNARERARLSEVLGATR